MYKVYFLTCHGLQYPFQPCIQTIDRHPLLHTSVHWDSNLNKTRGNAIRPQWPIWNEKERGAMEFEKFTRYHMKQKQKKRINAYS
uniref:Putative ovule protein n=1 Tax=Solanum chacoense TaxID=4108 RepID=A0A0V0GSG7_SOLCH